MSENSIEKTDIVLVGAGIMSATLGVMLKELNPNFNIILLESLSSVAAESSDAWNNAGTGHAALCELNYTPEGSGGKIDISKAVKINEQFEVSKQFWSYFVEKTQPSQAPEFLNQSPHISFVWGAKNADYLSRRYEALKACPCFAGCNSPQILRS